jgi:hypothetical protein
VVTEATESITITANTVSEKVKELEALEQQIAAAKVELKTLVGFLRAQGKAHWVPKNITGILDDSRHPTAVPRIFSSRKEALATLVVEALAQASTGLTFPALQHAIQSSEAGPAFDVKVNAIYICVHRLEEKNEVVKYKGYIFSKPQFESFSAIAAVCHRKLQSRLPLDC